MSKGRTYKTKGKMRSMGLMVLLLLGCWGNKAQATTVLISMNESQTNHLKAYGIIYWVLGKGGEADWLLNYEGGSFASTHTSALELECKLRGVSYKVIPDGLYAKIKAEITAPETNMDVVKLEKLPRIAVYSPKSKQPWDDAVTMVLTYAEIPYDLIFDEEVANNKLLEYDWLHLHHEDFTGQYGKFWSSYRNAAWYKAEVSENEAMAKKLGYAKVSQMKLAVVKKIKDFVSGGGYLFAMCSATDTYDIALSAEGVDICERQFDGDPADANANSKLDFNKAFAFKDFRVSLNPQEYEFSTIDVPGYRSITQDKDVFGLFEFSAKSDPIPTMLCQNHTRMVPGFMGQTTAFKKEHVKSEVLIMGENRALNEAKYIHGEVDKGMWTFYGGHDPEDYQHMIGEPPTDLNLHPNSPGYRLILNNVLFPAAKKQKKKT